MRQMNKFLYVFVIIVFFSCVTFASAATLSELYDSAITDAKIAKAEEISRSLIGISAPDNKNIPACLSWKTISNEPHVLVCTWAGSRITGKGWAAGETHFLEPTDNIWITADPQLKNFFSDNGFWPSSHADRILRVEQLLGLPHNSGKIIFIEFWVKPSDIFRPSADPDPSDHEAQLEYPWKRSHFQSLSAVEKIHEYVNSTDQNHEYDYKEWFENLNATSYSSPAPYPWTRLGYTYDWSDDSHNHNHVGLSEFIVQGGASIVIERIVSTDDLEEYFTKP